MSQRTLIKVRHPRFQGLNHDLHLWKMPDRRALLQGRRRGCPQRGVLRMFPRQERWLRSAHTKKSKQQESAKPQNIVRGHLSGLGRTVILAPKPLNPISLPTGSRAVVLGKTACGSGAARRTSRGSLHCALYHGLYQHTKRVI